MRRRIVCGVAMAIAVAFCFLKSFDVAPTHASLSGWTDSIAPNNWVAETFIANFDSAAEADVFIGEAGALAHYFNVEIRDCSTNVLMAYSYYVFPPAKGYVWLPFPMTPDQGQKFVRGKEYLVKVTRPGGRVNWFKDTTDKYPYGHMEGGNDTALTVKDDVCMKLFGKARVGGEFSMQSVVGNSGDIINDY